MMDPDAKEKWLKALRSGEYKQGKSALQDPNGSCCLGVLACEMGVPKRLKPNQGNMFFFEFKNSGIASPAMPPHGYCDITRDEMFKLVSMNDHEDKNFFEIADYIEENL